MSFESENTEKTSERKNTRNNTQQRHHQNGYDSFILSRRKSIFKIDIRI